MCVCVWIRGEGRVLALTSSPSLPPQGFERQSALFALVTADVLVVNMWHQHVGRYSAANYSLLKSIFEVNLQLAGDEDRPLTTLMFVIRDHIAEQTVSGAADGGGVRALTPLPPPLPLSSAALTHRAWRCWRRRCPRT